MKGIILLCFIFSSFLTAVAQDTTGSNAFQFLVDSTEFSEDDSTWRKSYDTISTTVSVRQFDSIEWRKIIGNADFNEAKTIHPGPPKPKEVANYNFGILTGAIRWAAYLVIAGLILTIIYFILRNANFNITSRKKKFVPDDLSKSVEDINNLDFGNSLSEAIAAGNLRLAVRIYYLRLLKKLNETKRIDWKREKTNRDYLRELFTKAYFYNEVQQLTIAYERIWYGEYTPSSETFSKLSNEFDSIDRQINPEEKL